uniref:Uncharacterized protein n=1 Tax=Sphaerodactylus townsendi TaxID=933632 RepID=A0ACB8EZV0_9SAUR
MQSESGLDVKHFSPTSLPLAMPLIKERWRWSSRRYTSPSWSLGSIKSLTEEPLAEIASQVTRDDPGSQNMMTLVGRQAARPLSGGRGGASGSQGGPWARMKSNIHVVAIECPLSFQFLESAILMKGVPVRGILTFDEDEESPGGVTHRRLR